MSGLFIQKGLAYIQTEKYLVSILAIHRTWIKIKRKSIKYILTVMYGYKIYYKCDWKNRATRGIILRKLQKRLLKQV